MQIVIDLPNTNITEDIIRAAKWEDGSLFDMALRGAIKNAIILPKGHGNLIDVNDLLNRIGLEDNDSNREDNVGEIITLEDIDFIPTIIETESGE